MEMLTKQFRVRFQETPFSSGNGQQNMYGLNA